MSLCLFGLCALPAAAAADGFFIPGLGSDQPDPRPSYRETYNAFPPPPHDMFGQPIPPTGVEPRPSYRQAYDQFPPAGGRYGGGFIEYVMTGGRPEPIAPQYAAPIAGGPVYAAPTYAPPAAYAGSAPPSYAVSSARARLPQSGLPDYAPQAPASYGGQPGYSAYAPAQSIYAQPQVQPVAYGAPGTSYDPAAADPGLTTRPMNPVYYRQMVAFSGRERPGTILIDTPNKFLYLVQPGGQAIRYGIGVGRPGFAWSGIKKISRKAEWPAWTPPSQMLARRPDLPRHMIGGEANPLGARALYLGSSLYRIHGTNEPYTIGTNVSSGCIRMMNQDVIDLYSRVGIGTRVVVM